MARVPPPVTVPSVPSVPSAPAFVPSVSVSVSVSVPAAAPAPASAALGRKRALPAASGQGPAPASLKVVLPGLKRLRCEAPASPTSVGDAVAAKTDPPAAMTSAAATAAAATASPASPKMQSMLRGLQHLADCAPGGCANPLCLSTRNFMAKVQTHLATAAARPGHAAARCGACQLWSGILRAHKDACGAAARCRVPGCLPPHQRDL